MEIVIQGLTYRYMAGTPYERCALADVDWTIPSGSFVAIIGGTGSGKTTLIQIIAGLMPPTRGHVLIGGIDDFSRLRGRVGVVFQYPEHQLFEETVAKDIAYGPLNLGLSQEEVNYRVEQAMDWVGLPRELASRSPFHLSGGQMRRVAIAGVLSMQPEVLVLDEPTAGLDPAGQRELMERMYTLHRERSMTVILVSHNMEEAATYAERVLVLYQGRKVAEGQPVDIFSRHRSLKEWGLETPEALRLADRLNRRLDPPLPDGLMTVDDLEEAILARWEGRPQ